MFFLYKKFFLNKKSWHFGLPLAQTISLRPYWQSLLVGGSVAIQTGSIYKVYLKRRRQLFFLAAYNTTLPLIGYNNLIIILTSCNHRNICDVNVSPKIHLPPGVPFIISVSEAIKTNIRAVSINSFTSFVTRTIGGHLAGFGSSFTSKVLFQNTITD